MGWLRPSFERLVDVAAALATPSCSIRNASLPIIALIAGGDEAGGVAAPRTVSLPMRRADLDGDADRRRRWCLEARTTSTSFILGTGLKKCMPTHAAGPPGGRRDLGDGEARRVRGQHDLAAAVPVELRERAQQGDLLGHGLDHEARASPPPPRGSCSGASAQSGGGGVGRGRACRGRRPRQIAADGGQRALEGVRGDVVEDRAEAAHAQAAWAMPRPMMPEPMTAMVSMGTTRLLGGADHTKGDRARISSLSWRRGAGHGDGDLRRPDHRGGGGRRRLGWRAQLAWRPPAARSPVTSAASPSCPAWPGSWSSRHALRELGSRSDGPAFRALPPMPSDPATFSRSPSPPVPTATARCRFEVQDRTGARRHRRGTRRPPMAERDVPDGLHPAACGRRAWCDTILETPRPGRRRLRQGASRWTARSPCGGRVPAVVVASELAAQAAAVQRALAAPAGDAAPAWYLVADPYGLGARRPTRRRRCPPDRDRAAHGAGDPLATTTSP